MSLTTNGLVQEMIKALGEEYWAKKEKPLPPGYEEDRDILFRAIAKGLLKYLEDNQNEFISTITFNDATGTRSVTNLDLNITP